MNEVMNCVSKYRLAVEESESARDDYRTASRRLGLSIVRYMKENKLSYAKLADSIGIQKQELFLVCRNRHCPSKRIVAKIEKYFEGAE
ncbi:MAG: hypothetical protein BWY98_00933 [Tenericutes bacterium ADurb.BinA155]|nr:MAG: hypothetical protein BWY98_00933 [Tenericutes bacterium ADurb.BinA155]